MYNRPTIAFLASLICCAPAMAQQGNSSDLMNRRIQSAKEVIDDSTRFQADAQRVHGLAQRVIAQATRLKGEAQVLQSSMPPIPTIKLNAEQMKAAQNDYHLHVEQFRKHAEAYQAHLTDFQHTLGECHANEDSYRKLAQQYQMHVDQFHIPMPNIRPPHICGAMNLSNAESMQLANKIREDNVRVYHAEVELAKQEQQLVAAQALTPALNNKVATAAVREQRENALYAEFGRLHEEYNLLSTEKQVLANSGDSIKVTRASVQGKLKH